MYEIIPLTSANLETIGGKQTIETRSIFITSLSLISKLINHNDYPIKNKTLAVKNILEFLRWVDVQLKIADTTIITIDSANLIKYLTTKAYKKYMALLSELQVMTAVPYDDGKFYEKKKRYTRYRIHNNYLNDDLCLVLMSNNKSKVLVTDAKYPSRFEKTIRHTKVNYRNAIKAEFEHHAKEGLTKNQLRTRLSSLFALNGDRYIKKGNRVDRVYHSFSNLSKVSRKHLHNDAKIFNDVDIKNCQPLLLCYLIKQKGLQLDDNYLCDCQARQNMIAIRQKTV